MFAARAGSRPLRSPETYRCRITAQGSLEGVGQSQAGLASRIIVAGAISGAPKLGARVSVAGTLAGGWRPKCLISVAGTLAGAPGGNTGNGFTAVRRIDIPADHVRGTSNIADYMLLVDETFPNLRSSGNGGVVQSTSGWDIRFELADGTKLDHELAEYGPTTGRAMAWVRVPTLSVTTGASIRMWYGKSGLSGTEANPTGAWRNYAAVWNARTGADRTGLGRTLTPANVTAGTLIGDAGDYNGTTANAQSAVGLPWLNGLSSITIEWWSESDSLEHAGGILSVGGGAIANQVAIIRYTGASNPGAASNSLVALINTTAGQARVEAPANSQTTDIQFGALRWASGQAASMYLGSTSSDVGGIVAPSNTPPVRTGTTDLGTDTALQLGHGLLTASWWPGLIDEVRIRGGVVSEGTLQTQEHNYRNPASFYGIGQEDAFTTTNLSVVAVPIVGDVTAGSSVDLDVRPRCVNPGAAALTIESYTTPSRGAVTTVSGKARYTPGGTAAGDGSFNYTVGNGQRSDTALATVRIAAEQVVTPPGDSILPTPFNYNGTTRQANTGNAQLVINGASDGDIIVLAAGTYGTLNIPNVDLWIRGATAPFTSIDCTPRYDLDDEMNADNDHSPRTARVTGLRALSDIAHVRLLQAANGNANIRISNIHTGSGTARVIGGGRIQANGAFNRFWVDHCWLESCDSRAISVRPGTSTDYQGTAPECVLFQNLVYANASYQDSANPPGPNNFCDYGTIIHGTMRVYIENCLYYGGFNHSISFKGGAGKTLGLVNRVVFSSRAISTGSNTAQLQLGQNIDNYHNGIGDITCGPITVTGCTFVAWNHPADFRMVAVGVQNVASVDVSGSVFGRYYAGTDSDGGFFRMVPGDRGFGGSETPAGLRAWRGDLNVHNNEFHSNHTFNPDNAGGDYSNNTLRFANNAVTAGTIRVNRNGHPTVYGANAGFADP